MAARWLAPARVDTVAVLGTGIQARRQVEALRCVRDLSEIRVWGRDMDRAMRAAHDIGAMVSDSVQEAVTGATVVITATASREPLVDAAWIAPGAHITAVGSDGVGKQELDPELLRRADVVAVDSLDQCQRLGELQHAPDQAGRAVELGRICAGEATGRTGEASAHDLRPHRRRGAGRRRRERGARQRAGRCRPVAGPLAVRESPQHVGVQGAVRA